MPPVARPAARPKMTRAEVIAAVRAHHPDVVFEGRLTVVGIRGYYRDGLGAKGRNDRGIYDDALFVIGDGLFAAFNANTDPSRVRAGSGTGTGKGMASLKPGVWPVYRFDLHAGKYLALCQRAGPVVVRRDGAQGPYEDRGNFGINIHRGGETTTGSEGCQTLPPAQWPDFIASASAHARRIWGAKWNVEPVTYVLLEDA